MSRERPAIEVDSALGGQRVAAVLERLASTHGLPKTRFVDHGPECTPSLWAPGRTAMACSRHLAGQGRRRIIRLSKPSTLGFARGV
jgi:hypothetical protein